MCSLMEIQIRTRDPSLSAPHAPNVRERETGKKGRGMEGGMEGGRKGGRE